MRLLPVVWTLAPSSSVGRGCSLVLRTALVRIGYRYVNETSQHVDLALHLQDLRSAVKCSQLRVAQLTTGLTFSAWALLAMTKSAIVLMDNAAQPVSHASLGRVLPLQFNYLSAAFTRPRG